MPPSPSDVALVRRLFDSFGDRFEEMRAGNIDGFFLQYYTEDALIESPDAFPAPTSVRGVEEYRGFFLETYGPYEGVTWELEALDLAGDSVVAKALIRGRSAADPGGLEIEVRVSIAYELRDGRICRSRLYLRHDRALEAALDGA
jgi:ketosteroid isomerase-like protein